MSDLCNIPQEPVDESAPQQSESSRKIDWMHAIFGGTTRSEGGESRLPQQIIQDQLDKRNAAWANSFWVNPEQLTKMDAWVNSQLAAKFGQLRNLGVDPLNLSSPGKIRSNLQEAKRIGYGVVSSITNYYLRGRLEEAAQSAKKIFAEHGIRGKKADELWSSFIEYGQIPAKNAAYDNAALRLFNEKRYSHWLNEVQSLGVTSDEIGELHSLIESTSYVQKMVADSARALGVDLGDLEGIGYLPRLFTPQALELLKNAENVPSDLFVQLANGAAMFDSVHNIKRTYNHVAPLIDAHQIAAFVNNFANQSIKLDDSGFKMLVDEAKTLQAKLTRKRNQLRKTTDAGAKATLETEIQGLEDKLKELDDKLPLGVQTTEYRDLKKEQRNLKQQKRRLSKSAKKLEANAEEIAKIEERIKAIDEQLPQLDVRLQESKNNPKQFATPEMILDSWNDPANFVKLLQSFDKLRPDLLSTMHSNGWLTHLPMTSDEVTRHFLEKYQLFGLTKSDFIESNVPQVLKAWSKEIARTASDNELFNYIDQEGVKQGWALTGEQWRDAQTLPAGTQKKDWVHLSDPEYWSDMGVKMNRVGVTDSYVHKYVADQLKAVMFISSQPHQLSGLASGWMHVNRIARTSLLGTVAPGYLARVYLSNLYAVIHGSKYNPLSIPIYVRSINDVYALLQRNGGAMMRDDIKQFNVGGEMHTPKRAFEEMLNRRYQEYVAQSPGDIAREPVDFKTWVSKVVGGFTAPVNPKFWATGAKYAHMSNPGDKSAFTFIKSMGKYVFKQGVESMESWFAPFAAHANMSDLASRWSLMQMRAGEQWDSWQQMMEAIDEVVYAPDATGTFAKAWGSVVQPFASFAMWSAPATIRHALRNPTQFYTYNKLMSLYSDNNNKQCGNTDLTNSSWSLEGYPITLGCDGDGNAYMLHPESVDTFSDSWSFLTGGGDKVSIPWGSSGNDLRKRGETLAGKDDPLKRTFEKAVDRSYLSGAYQFFSGRDTFKGEDFDPEDKMSWWFIPEMSPRLHALLSSIPIPQLQLADYVNRTNPGGLMGLEQRTDVYGKVIRPEQLSIFNTKRKGSKDKRYDDAVAQNVVLSVLRNVTGTRITSANMMENLSYSERDIAQSITEAKALYTSQQNKFKRDYNKLLPDEQAKRYKELADYAGRIAMLEYEHARINGWMQSRGIPTSEYAKELNKIRTDIGGGVMEYKGIPQPDMAGQLKVFTELQERLRLEQR